MTLSAWPRLLVPWQQKRGERHFRGARRYARILPAVCVAGCLAACAAAPPAVRLPPKPTARPPGRSAAAAVPPQPRQQVVAALGGYTSALTQAEDSGSVATARQLLLPYLAARRIGGLVAAISAIWHRGQSFYGRDVLHILSVRIAGRRAYVHDCDDTSGMGLRDTATGQVVPGSVGSADANLTTQLERVDGHWLVAAQLPEDVPCAG